MASPNDDTETDERKELEMKQKAFIEKKRAAFERTREELQQICQEEMTVRKRLQELDEMELEQMRKTLESFKTENAKLKRELREKQNNSLDDMTLTARATGSSSNIEHLEAEQSEKDAVCEHRQEADVVNMRRQNVEQNATVRKLKETMQRIDSYSKSQQKEKDQALRKVASLRDEVAVLKQISAETQQRQLDELQSSSLAMKQPLLHTGTLNAIDLTGS